MEQGDWDNDADYPRAPLPEHERTWRHPSELGAAHWVRSEPPLVVGRGLSVATGTVGAVLALGLLWLMIPHNGNTDDIATGVSTTSVRTSAIATTSPPSRESSAATGSSGSIAESTTAVSTSTESSVASTAAPASSLALSPVPTMVLAANETAEAMPAIAVALVPGHYVVTTAAAVRGREGVAVQLPSGETVVGAVVAIDAANGTAVLSISSDIDSGLIEISQADPSVGGFVVMSPEATSASLWVDEGGTMIGYEGDGSETGEGSVVLDSDGRLIGLCTRSAAGLQLVSAAALLEALASATSNESITGTPPWLGIKADVDASGRVVVTQVIADGPAAAAGLAVGDVIIAIDGAPLADLDTLRSTVTSHVPGETLTLTIERPAPRSTNTTAGTTAGTTTGTTSTTLAATTTNATSPTTSAPMTGTGNSTGVSAASTATTAVGTTAAPTTAALTTVSTLATTATTLAAATTLDIVITLSQQPGSL